MIQFDSVFRKELDKLKDYKWEDFFEPIEELEKLYDTRNDEYHEKKPNTTAIDGKIHKIVKELNFFKLGDNDLNILQKKEN